MDPNEHYTEQFPARYEQSTLPVLSRSPPKVPWPATDQSPIADPYTISPPDALTPQTPKFATTAPPPAPPPAQATKTERNASSKVRKPRKPANAAAGKSTLFWVNTDPQSASTGTKEETLKRIRSHVMSEHNRKKRLENTKRYKSKTFKHLAFQPPETVPGAFRPPRPPAVSPVSSSSSSSRRSSHVVEQINSSQELIPATTAAVNYYPGGSVEAWDDSWNDSWDDSWDDSNFDGVVGYQSRRPAPSVWTYLGSGAHDPFNTGHTQLTDRMMRHLQNCEYHLRGFGYALLTVNSPLGPDAGGAPVADAV
jgi:hypothetical protein